VIIGAFVLVCRIAGPTIELPPRSNRYAIGKVRRAASSTEARPEVQPTMKISETCCAAKISVESVAATANERASRRWPKTKAR